MQTTSHSSNSVPLLLPHSPHSSSNPQHQTRLLQQPIDSQSVSNTQMEKPVKVESLSPIRDDRRILTHPSSPEFEFWMVRNPSLPQPNMLSADELFVDGVLLPLHLLPSAATPLHESTTAETVVQENDDFSGGPELTAPASVTGSRRWKDMFKKASKEIDQKVESTKMNKKRERKSGTHGGASSAELNINIWPFSRSRSAGNGGGARTKIASSRKVSSAPCSRSNSGGESKSRKWPASPSRAGVHVGRSSPVWQVRRGGSSTAPRSSTGSEAVEIRKGRVLKSCKQGAAAGSGGEFAGHGFSRKGSGGSNDGSGVVNLFSLRIFGKKVY